MQYLTYLDRKRTLQFLLTQYSLQNRPCTVYIHGKQTSKIPSSFLWNFPSLSDPARRPDRDPIIFTLLHFSQHGKLSKAASALLLMRSRTRTRPDQVGFFPGEKCFFSMTADHLEEPCLLH